MSNYFEDLNKEKILSRYLDKIYSKKGFDFERINNINEQHQGIDIEIQHNNETYYIDEKAQLDYLNTSLPTFAFEISYIKQNTLKKGWLFDSKKKTTHYFLITGIHVSNDNIKNGVQKCIITSINREKLILHLHDLGLTKVKLESYDTEIRQKKKPEYKTSIPEIPIKYGNLFFSTQKAEKPINLVLKLDYLIKNGIGKRIH